MKDPKILNLISKHLSNEETPEEKEAFQHWLNESPENTTVFNGIKNSLEGNSGNYTLFRKKLTKENITDILIQQVLGNMIGFAVGMWITNSFTHYVTEKKGIKNLFGMAGRKKVLVNDIPEWIQYTLSFILGFIALELVNYFFQTKKHIAVWNFMKSKFQDYQLNRATEKA